MTSTAGLTVSSVLLVLGVACADQGTPQPVVVRDSAGIRVVDNRQAEWNGRGWSIDPVASVEIGDEADGGPQLFRVRDILGLDDRIAVLNAGSTQILLFDSIGELIRRVGGRGAGPGEFTRLVAMYRCGGDTLVVNDFSRVSLFNANGDFLRTQLIEPARPKEVPRVRGVASDCSTFLMSTAVPPAATRTGANRLSNTVFWSHLDATGRDTLGVFPGQEVVARRIEGLDQALYLPWGADGVWTIDGDAFLFGNSERAEIRRFERGKGPVTIIRWPAPRLEVSSDDRKLYEEKRAWLLDRFPQGAAVAPPLGDFPSVPADRPFFRSFLVDDEGNLWVRRYPRFLAGRPDLYDTDVPRRYSPPPGREPEAYTVFDRQGRWLGDVDIPPDISVRAVYRGKVMGVWKDALDVERVRVYRLRRPGG